MNTDYPQRQKADQSSSGKEPTNKFPLAAQESHQHERQYELRPKQSQRKYKTCRILSLSSPQPEGKRKQEQQQNRILPLQQAIPNREKGQDRQKNGPKS